MLVPRKKLLWSSVTTGNSDDEGCGDVRFIAEARLANARTKYLAQTHKHVPQNETLAVACWITFVSGTFERIPDPRLLIREVPILEIRCILEGGFIGGLDCFAINSSNSMFAPCSDAVSSDHEVPV